VDETTIPFAEISVHRTRGAINTPCCWSRQSTGVSGSVFVRHVKRARASASLDGCRL